MQYPSKGGSYLYDEATGTHIPETIPPAAPEAVEPKLTPAPKKPAQAEQEGK